MKIIPKFQKGSSFEQFYTVYQPIDYGSGTSSTSSKSSKKSDDDDKGKLTEKDLMSMLKDMDGLPNEMQAIANDLIGMMRYENLTGISSSHLNTQYISNLYKVKHAKFNKDQYDDAYNRSKETGSLNDIAINPNGTVVVQNAKGEMTTLTPEQYVSNKGEYTPVTNSNLLWLRAHNPNYINNNQVFQVVENGIGLDAVHKMIKDRSEKLGTSDEAYDMYVSKDVLMGDKLLNQFVQAGPDGYYKLSKSLNATQKEQINAALNYIYVSLPENAKTRLKLETKTGTEQEAQAIILSLMAGQLNSKDHTNLLYIGDEAKLKGKGSGGDDDDMNKQPATMADAFLKGYGQQNILTLNAGTEDGYQVVGISVPLTNAEDKPIGSMASVSDITKGNFEGILDINHATLGDKHIMPAQFGGLLTVSGQVTSIDFPVMPDGYTPVTDPKIFKAKKDADAKLKQEGIDLTNEKSVAANYKRINEIYESEGLQPAYDENGKLTNNWKRFAVIDVYADDNIIGGSIFDDKPLFKEVTEDGMIDLINDALKDENYTKHGFLSNLFGYADHIYEGLLWIPVNVDYNVSSVGKSVTWGQQDERNRITQDLNREQAAKGKIGTDYPN